jgi:hypothetical protein
VTKYLATACTQTRLLTVVWVKSAYGDSGDCARWAIRVAAAKWVLAHLENMVDVKKSWLKLLELGVVN